MTEAGPDVSARLAWPDDAAAIAQIQWASWAEIYPEVNPADIDVDVLAARWQGLIAQPKDARLRVLVALERAEIRGFAVVHPSFDPDSDQVADGEIGELGVARGHLGQGHGSRLLQAAADTLRADGFKRIVWWINSTDDDGRAFATSAGWAADGAHRELEAESGERIKQIRLHTGLT